MVAPCATVGASLRGLMEDAVRHLESFPRPSASDGEHRAALWVADALSAEGCAVSIEEERAHGTYWWPLGLMNLIAATCGLRARGRVAAGVIGAAAVAGIYDDTGGGRLWFRRMLPRRRTTNVVAEAGDLDGGRTVLFVAHHDAAHTSVLFHPGAAPAMARVLGKERYESHMNVSPPVMAPVIAGPALIALGALMGRRWVRTIGSLFSLGSASAFMEIGMRPTVPGANDNLSGVAALLGIARVLREQPVPGIRVLLVSTGAEESFMEGMQAFGARHFKRLPIETTDVFCLETIGSPELVQIEGEGMLRMRPYDAGLKDLVDVAAREEGLPLRRGLWFRNATDGLIAMRAGYRAVLLGSVNRFKVPDNYHWPTDVADNVDFGTIEAAVRICHRSLRLLAAASGERS
jgi:hypothetical protein